MSGAAVKRFGLLDVLLHHDFGGSFGFVLGAHHQRRPGINWNQLESVHFSVSYLRDFVGVTWYGQLGKCGMTISGRKCFLSFEIFDPLTGNNCDEIYANLWRVNFVFELPQI